MRNLLLLGVALGSLGACKWSEFDDIEGEAWVASTERPDNSSTIWAIALAPAQHTGTGGALAVFGASEPIYNEVIYTDTGSASIGTNVLEFEDLGFGTFTSTPIVLENPDTDELALLTQPTSQTVLFYGVSNQFDYRELSMSTVVDAATYINPEPAATSPAVVLSADEDKLFGVNRDNDLSTCSLKDAGTAVIVRAMAAARPSGAGEDLLVVWSTDGKLRAYPSTVFYGEDGAGCPAGTSVDPVATATVDFMPSDGSRIIDFRTVPNGLGRESILLVGRDSTRTFMQLYTVGAGTFTPVGTSVMTDRAQSSTVLSLAGGGGMYVVLGIPTATVENTPAGQVKLFALDGTMGVDTDVALVLNDAQPEENQQFGRSVAAIPYNSGQVLAVGADNEVFVYFQTELYSETRTGR